MTGGRAALALAALLGAFVEVPRARACSVCGTGDPLLGATDPAALTARLRLQLDTEYLRAEARSAADPGATERLTQWSVRLDAAYRPTEDLALSGTAPLVTKAVDRLGAGATTRVSTATGLGDAQVAARYTLARAFHLGTGRGLEAAVSAGTSIPSGPDDLEANGVRLEEHAQPGSGSWGPFAGVHGILRQGSWLSFASVSARVRTANRHGYRYGASALWSVHGQYLVARRVALDLGLDGGHAAADRTGGGAVPDTGGSVVSAAPGLYVGLGAAPWLFVRGQVPVYQRLRGTQRQLPSVVMGVQVQVM